MNHRPYEDWLLENQPLDPIQKQDLKKHVETCPTCSALVEVDLALKSSRQITPPPGFTSRFKVKLEADRRKMRQRRYFWLGLAGLTFLILAGWAGVALVVLTGNPASNLLVSVFNWMVITINNVRNLGSISLVLLKVGTSFIPLSIWATVAGGGLLLIMGWFGSLWKLVYSTNARRLA